MGPYVSLADYAASAGQDGDQVPPWVLPQARVPAALDNREARLRVEDVLDTIVALQRAEWLEDGVYVGPHALGTVYRDVLEASRRLQVAVPPAIVSGCAMKSQSTWGTDGCAVLHLSSFFFTSSATEAERQFLVGRLAGHVAARQVTALTLYALVVDQDGVRRIARRAVGPAFEFLLAPLSLGVQVALSRWHRAAELAADRAGLLCCNDVLGARRALLRVAMGMKAGVEPDEYLEQLKQVRHEPSPGRFAELLQDQPWMHKRMQALADFAQSELWVRCGGTPAVDQALLSDEELQARATAILGVST